MVVVRDRVTVDRMDDRTENKGPLTGDAVPVTRLLTTSYERLGRCRSAASVSSRGRQSFRTAQLIPTRWETNGDADPYALI